MTDVRKANALFAMTMFIHISQIFIFSSFPGLKMDSFTAMVLPELVLIMPSVFYIFALKCGPEDDISKEINYKFVGLGTILMIVLVTYAAEPITMLLNLLTSIGKESAGESIANVFEGMPMWAALIAVALVPAVCEEFVFRGCLYGALRKKNKLMAIIVTSIMFGILHLNVNQFSYAFVLGIVLCLMVEATGTVVASTIAHFIFNGSSVLLTYALNELQSGLTEEELAQIQQEANASTSATRAEIIVSIVVVVLIYILAVLVIVKGLKRMARINGNKGVFKAIFSKEGIKENNIKGTFFDIFLVLGLAVGILFIVIVG